MAKKMKPPKKMQGPVLSEVDKELATHLRKAEEHLIAAVKLFGRKRHPDRHPDFQQRLVRAQELVTWIRRDELIRARGPIRVRVGGKK